MTTTTPTFSSLQEHYTSLLNQLRAELQYHVQHAHIADDQAMDQFLSNPAMDNKLGRFVLMYEASPQGLAQFAIQGPLQQDLIHQLLLSHDSSNLIQEMLLADGPQVVASPSSTGAPYGPAMQIYQQILATSPKANNDNSGGVLHRLALAVALEHAIPIPQRNAAQAKDAPLYVDPIQRYLHYEKALLEGELDPSFEQLTTWELRFVVNGEEPDEIAAWGRHMLRNYRPDHVLTADYTWKYVGVVRTNIRYGSQDVKNDQPNLQFFQNILLNGGVCGRRAFFGRFVLRASGIPTTARPSPGHGALIHWMPHGEDWVACLGGPLGCGTTNTRYTKDLDFCATAKARRNRQDYWKVKRATWYGDVMGEERIYGEHQVNRGESFWYNVSLKVQKAILEHLPAKNVVSSCHEKDPGGQPNLIQKLSALPIAPNAKTICYETDGTIIIPAAAFVNPQKTKDVQVHKSFHPNGGLQIYLPPFTPQGLTIMRGGTFKMDAGACCSGARIKSGGYGKYNDWGFRVAISGGDGSDEKVPQKYLTIGIGKANVPMEFVYIEPGSFVMGGECTKDGRFECVEVPKHPVQLTKGFYLGKYPVTQEQYTSVMGNNPSQASKAPTCPVDTIGENDCNAFCDKLVETIGKDFRLPTEAEWESACRAGQGDQKWFFGDDPSMLGDYAWFKGNSQGKSHPVGQKKPNPFGLYDMYGNVFERVSDKYDKNYYATSPAVDPTGPSHGTMSTFEYVVNISRPGEYKLVADVVTANEKQCINICVNNNNSSLAVQLPFTIGLWQTSSPIIISLDQGQNTIRFWRDKPPQYGVAIKSFTLRPVENMKS